MDENLYYNNWIKTEALYHKWQKAVDKYNAIPEAKRPNFCDYFKDYNDIEIAPDIYMGVNPIWADDSTDYDGLSNDNIRIKNILDLSDEELWHSDVHITIVELDGPQFDSLLEAATFNLDYPED